MTVKKTDTERALEELERTLAIQKRELASVEVYASQWAKEFAEHCRRNIRDTEEAIANVKASGLPEGWVEKWAPAPKPNPWKRRRR